MTGTSVYIVPEARCQGAIVSLKAPGEGPSLFHLLLPEGPGLYHSPLSLCVLCALVQALIAFT